MSRIYYCVERGGACYGSSLVRAESEGAVARAAARGVVMTIVERATRPDVAGWCTPCDDRGFGRRKRR